jgi:NitT/TauT family transport system permease protein
MFADVKGAPVARLRVPQRRPATWGSWLWRYQQSWLTPLVIIAALLLWEGLVRWQNYPAFILPGPLVVWHKFTTVLADGTLARHVWFTLLEVLLGLVLGLSTALLLGYGLGKSRTVERILAPYIVVSQSVPIVAVAPLLVIWVGSGLASKVLVCALITFFPTLINTIVGIRSVDPDLREVLQSLRASRWQTFQWLELPSALPMLFSGLKLSVILAVVGAVVGEFVGADVGLGFLINLARGILDTPLMFVAVFCLIAMAQIFYLSVSLVEHHYLHWRE